VNNNHYNSLKESDPEIYSAIQDETERERDHLELIASENFVSRAVLEAQGSTLTNKYAEGYPGKRYYGGCENVDVAEALAIERVKKLFGAQHANVQAHSGSQANMEVYFSVLSPGDRILAMSLAAGGHLTHGYNVNFSGYLYWVVTYGLDPRSERIDYEHMQDLARRFKPKMVVAGASAYPRIIEFEPFKKVAEEIGAIFLVDMAHFAGLVAAGLHPNPVPCADFVTSTTHKTLRGPRGGFILCTREYAKRLDLMVFPGIQGGPLMHVIAAKAVCFKEAMTDEFREYQNQIVKNAKALAAELVRRKFELVTGGTDNHLMLVKLMNKNLSGKEAEDLLEEAGITVNKNLIPGDKLGPLKTSGIRIGSPALTTRGMKEAEMEKIAGWIDDVLSHPGREIIRKNIRKKVTELCEEFPLYPRETAGII